MVPRSDAAQLYRIICHVLTYNSNKLVQTLKQFLSQSRCTCTVLYILETEKPANVAVHIWAFLPKAAGAPILRPFVTPNLFRKKNFSSSLFLLPLHVARLLSIRLLFRDARKRASINPDRTSTSSHRPPPFSIQTLHQEIGKLGWAWAMS